ncbi:hypothetical protein RvY_09614 [Ramazzottius varieornatus]|uniref:NADH dehydrogenase [ubiquinone] 1 alpha subcomplex assembly factor 3 n=1 Tax=Ramazzottius varieornatus TaxID=947166 RepID=A0A1D1VA07_RAMVA|nr:hypothetical protein RvY_09614 [Ramazzottius varieornatus]
MAVRLGRKGWSSLSLCRSCRFGSSKPIGPEDHPARASRIPEQGAWLPEFDVEVDTFQKTTVKVMNNDEDRYLLVNAYSNAGFRLNNGVVAIGPIALFPKTCIQWNVSSVKDLTAAAFSLFYLLDPKLDILVIGVGDNGNQLDFELIKELMKKRRLGLEILPTDKAVTTFNWLNTERRSVAGAFIPPKVVHLTDMDLHETMERRLGDKMVDSVIT